MKKLIKADGSISFVNPEFIDSVFEEGDTIEEVVIDRTPPSPSEEEIAADYQQQINQNNLKYLQETDWYVTRYIESGVEIPNEIKVKRAEARSAIV